MEIKVNRDFLYATKLTRETSFLETDDERNQFRNAIYSAIIWGKTH